jgi:mannose-6-phosphate isomerase-like protein (cupin superfamily)
MILRTAAALMALVIAVSCAASGNGKGLLPAVNPSTVSPSSYQPEQPFTAQSDGALARPVFRTDGASAYRADIRDVLVPPGKSTTLAHDGIVVVDTREGTGMATVQDRPIELTAGKTFGISQGQTARVQNTGQTPLVLRVYIVTVP